MVSCAQFLGIFRLHKDKDARRSKESGRDSTTLDLTLQSKDISVRIVHAGGREELYQNAVSVSELLERYPGMCVARPEVFKNSHESLLLADENLVPGQKYYMIPSTTAQKLKCKHRKLKVKGPANGNIDKSDESIVSDVHDDDTDESFPSAKDYYISKENWSGLLRKRGVRKKKPFVPPLPSTRTGCSWEPSLTSVQEISP